MLARPALLRPSEPPRRRFGDPDFISCRQQGYRRDGTRGDCHRSAEMWCKADDDLFCRIHSWLHKHEHHDPTLHRWL